MCSGFLLAGLFDIEELEKEREVIEKELSELAFLSLNTGTAPMGFRSELQSDPDNLQWVEIEFEEEVEVDLIVIVPTIVRDENGEVRDEGFPGNIRIKARNDLSADSFLLAEISDTSTYLPRVAPLAIALDEPMKVSSVKIEVSRLGAHAVAGKYTFQLAEIMIFSGEELVSLKQKLTLQSKEESGQGWKVEYLLDGVTPYLMNAAQGASSRPLVNAEGLEGSPEFLFDLGEETCVDGVRFHLVEQQDTYPSAYSGNFGMPQFFAVEGALNMEKGGWTNLLEVSIENMSSIGPIMQWGFPRKKTRYVKLKADRLYKEHSDGDMIPRIGFGEIEILANGRNVAKDADVTVNFKPSDPRHHVEQINDGLNFYGEILPLRQWMEELARRHDLDRELLVLNQEISKSNKKQRGFFKIIFTLLTLVVIITCSLYWLRRVKFERLIRSRIASNLHDELGANLHAIKNLAELAREAILDPDELAEIIDDINSVAKTTGGAARDCSSMLKNPNRYNDIAYEMKRNTHNILADLDYALEIRNEENLYLLSKRTRIDLILYLKEGLINIIRHSHASEASITMCSEVSVFKIKVTLEIADNGIGLNQKIPSALKRRAHYLNAKMLSLENEGGGTLLTLTLKKYRRPSFFTTSPIFKNE